MTISIIIPVYNVASWLGTCLDSIVAAGGRASDLDVEVVCIDDGSTDGSGRLLDDYVRQVERAGDGVKMSVVHQENRGVSAARNAGLELATGDYLWFVDGDDVIAPESFVVLDEAIRAGHSPDIVQFRNERFIEEPRFPVGDGGTVCYDLTRKADLRAAYDEHALWLLGSSAIYSRAKFGAARFEGYANCEDSLWGRRAFYKATSLVFLDRALYGYRQRGDSANNVWTKRHWDEYCKVSWLMTKEGLSVKGIRRRVLIEGLKCLKHSRTYRKLVRDWASGGVVASDVLSQ